MAAAALVWTVSAEQFEQAAHKNVLVIVLDDLGTDKLAMYGETPPSCPPYTCVSPPNCVAAPTGCVRSYAATPNLDTLRAQGILFTRAYANPVCSPTRASIQTGRYGLHTGVGHLTNSIQYPAIGELPDAEVFLSELVIDGHPTIPSPPRGLPYKTGAFGKWHLTTLNAADRGHAVDNGFQRFYGSMGNVGNHFNWEKVQHDAGSSPTASQVNATVPNPDEYTTDYWQTSHTRADAANWIAAQSNSFLAYVCFNAPHAPLQVPPISLLSSATQCELACANLDAGDIVNVSTHSIEDCRLVYRAMIEAVDTEIGALVNGMSAAKRANTMIFVIGDNGTPGPLMDSPHVTSQGKATVYETGIRVPLIVSGPLVDTPIPSGGWTSDALVDAVDLWRTIAQITSSSVTAAAPLSPLDSKSFLSVIQDPTTAGSREFAFSQSFLPLGVWTLPLPANFCFTNNMRSMSNGPYKLVRLQVGACPPRSFVQGFIHLPTDPHELNNLMPAIIGGTATQEQIDNYNELTAEMDALSGP